MSPSLCDIINTHLCVINGDRAPVIMHNDYSQPSHFYLLIRFCPFKQSSSIITSGPFLSPVILFPLLEK